MTGEDRFVEKLRAMLPADPRVVLGPGDDAALVRSSEGLLAATTDMLVEGVDFLPEEDPYGLGRRALAVNLSDLAAMGVRPEFFLLSIGFSAQKGEAFPLAVAAGALSRARPLDVSLIGGDLSRSPQTVISVALFGKARDRAASRSGGSPGDLLYLSGFPGRAAAGLRLARGESQAGGSRAALAPDLAAELLAAHRDPEPRLALGLELARRGLWSAAIDVSDGVGVDAGRLARASGLRAILEKERIPVSPALAAFAAFANTDPFDWILSGGDDYELLFAAPPGKRDAVESLASRDVPVTLVGRLERGEGAALREHTGDREISALGHDHFEIRA